jgi:BTB/POZ domain
VQEEVKAQVGTKSSKLGSSPRTYLDVPDADVILRSADLVNFRAHKSALTMASPFFKDLLSLPQPPDSEVMNGLPVVQLSEDAEVLNYLIPMLYPVRHVIPWFESKLLSLLAACQKYDMVSIQSSIRDHVHHRRSNLFGAGAFGIYAIASSKRLIPEMEKAARLTLDYPMTFETLGEGLRLFEGQALHDLFCFRRRCRDNIVACLESFLQVRAKPSKIWVGCPDAMHHSPRPGNVTKSMKNVLPRWLCDILTRERDRIQRGLTCPLDLSSSIRHELLTALRAHADCHFCLRVHVTEEGSRFCDALSWELYQACEKVETPSIAIFHIPENDASHVLGIGNERLPVSLLTQRTQW